MISIGVFTIETVVLVIISTMKFSLMSL